MKKLNKNKKLGFSMIEISICIAILGVIGCLTLYSIKNFVPKVDKLRFKTANLTFKHALSNLLNNPKYYSLESGFLDLRDVEFGDDYIPSDLPYNGPDKFRNLLLLELGVNVINSNLSCYMIKDSISSPEIGNICYRSDNGLVWAIPDTNFNGQGTVKYQNHSGGTSKYVPVTIYSNAKKIDTISGFYNSAITIGVRADGSTMLLLNKDFDCKDSRFSNYAQCQVEDYLSGINMKKRN